MKKIFGVFILAILFFFSYSSLSSAQTPELRKIEAQLQEAKADTNTRISSLENKVEILVGRFETLKEITNISQKNVDWWIASLSVILTIIGIAIPVLFTISFRANYKLAIAEVNRAEEDSKSYLNEIAENHKLSQSHIEDMARRRSEMMDSPLKVDAQSAATASESVVSPAAAVVAEVLNDPKSSDTDRLRASALSAEDKDDWETAADLWHALSILEPGSTDVIFRQANAMNNEVHRMPVDVAIPHLNKAIKLTRTALAKEPSKGFGFVVLGRCLSKLSDRVGSKEERSALKQEAILALKNEAIETGNFSGYGETSIGVLYHEVAGLTEDATLKESYLRKAIPFLISGSEKDPKSSYAATSLLRARIALFQVLKASPEKDELLRLIKNQIGHLTIHYKNEPFTLTSIGKVFCELAKDTQDHELQLQYLESAVEGLRYVVMVYPDYVWARELLKNAEPILAKLRQEKLKNETV